MCSCFQRPKAWGVLCGTELAAAPAPASAQRGLGVQDPAQNLPSPPLHTQLFLKIQGICLNGFNWQLQRSDKNELTSEKHMKEKGLWDSITTLLSRQGPGPKRVRQGSVWVTPPLPPSQSETHQAVLSESSGKEQDRVQGMCSSTPVLQLTSSVD